MSAEPPYLARVNAMLDFINGISEPVKLYALFETAKWAAFREWCPKREWPRVETTISAARKRLNIKGDSNRQMAG